MNRYQRNPEYTFDLHGCTTAEAKKALDDLIAENRYSHVRIITGKGNHSPNGGVLGAFVKNYLNARGFRFNQSKIQDGGEGALEAFMK